MRVDVSVRQHYAFAVIGLQARRADVDVLDRAFIIERVNLVTDDE